MSNNTDNLRKKIKALASHLDCRPREIETASYDHYGMTLLEYGSEQWAVGTDEEADNAAKDYIEGSVWSFNASFILNHCDLPYQLEDAIRSWQEAECEGANEGLLELIERLSSIEDFANEAIRDDGRGHFMSSYDGEEQELDGDFFAYRIN